MAPPRVPVRRRPRSVRVTGALVLLAVAAAGVLAVLVSAPSWPVLAAVGTLALFAGAVRCMWGEVLHSRRANAADRAAAAAAYRALFGASTAEHTEFTNAMTERLAEAHMTQRELEGLVTQLESRAQGLQHRLLEAQARVRQLEEALALASTPAESVTALAAWEEQAAQKMAQKMAQKGAEKAAPPSVQLRSALKRA